MGAVYLYLWEIYGLSQRPHVIFMKIKISCLAAYRFPTDIDILDLVSIQNM